MDIVQNNQGKGDQGCHSLPESTSPADSSMVLGQDSSLPKVVPEHVPATQAGEVGSTQTADVSATQTTDHAPNEEPRITPIANTWPTTEYLIASAPSSRATTLEARHFINLVAYRRGYNLSKVYVPPYLHGLDLHRCYRSDIIRYLSKFKLDEDAIAYIASDIMYALQAYRDAHKDEFKDVELPSGRLSPGEWVCIVILLVAFYMIARRLI
ncbi:hypothetical protein CONLIGDRAFT_692512 [Coniochaeta ligniaria NRRL 30616]|uniref:Uncharacterized protein n=1 Tax=Coniochaeta ligniaria NRRL 30616 TaxID=1408157 RepID=A0A1J7IA62_9PEZI|nr:hypothetical protein CONLIGDRAFT_692512 [Coniochaeta ligniaria NRRL 30616]